MKRSGGWVVVVGSANVDYTVRTERLPNPGETVVGTALPPAVGGKGLNVAVAAGRMGAAVKLFAKMGDDAGGNLIRDFLGQEQAAGSVLDLAGVRCDEASPTGSAFITVDALGANIIVVAGSANLELAPDDITASFTKGDVLATQHEIPAATVQRALQLAADGGALRILNPSPVSMADPVALSMANIVVLNVGELRRLSPSVGDGSEAGIRSAVADIRHKHQIFIVTRGASGCMVITPNETRSFPACSAESLDSTGAGDCFLGALASSLVGRDTLPDLFDAVDVATRAAALSVQRLGAASSMPYAHEVRLRSRVSEVPRHVHR